ncbi:MAG: glycosyltransferase family 4 protein [Leptolyngbyaceae cyanobacterium SM1_3_5]|nr:glycosyltransferase family 4 protein [Leptolyngbyaceae cyanobacterium SM1_3_5]
MLEAMACGCPVITSTAPAISEVCGNAAIQVDPQSIAELSQAIRRIAVDDDLYQKLKHDGFEQNARFSWERCAKETLVVYEQAMKTYGSRSKVSSPFN